MDCSGGFAIGTAAPTWIWKIWKTFCKCHIRMAMKTDLRAKFKAHPPWKHQFEIYILVCIRRWRLFFRVYKKNWLLLAKILGSDFSLFLRLCKIQVKTSFRILKIVFFKHIYKSILISALSPFLFLAVRVNLCTLVLS